MAEQFNKAGGALGFSTPFVEEGESKGSPTQTTGGIIFPSKLKLIVDTDCKNVKGIIPTLSRGVSNLFFGPANGLYNNLGVPGAKASHVLSPGYGDPAGLATGTANPFYARFCSNPGNNSVLDDAIAQNPTFFTYWLGTDDITGYALAGGVGANITPTTDFSAHVNEAIDRLTANGAKGVIFGIPDITSLPYFNAVPINVGNDFFVIEDTSVEGGIRQATSADKLLLTTPANELKCNGTYGKTPSNPIPDKLVLTKSELFTISQSVDAYNIILKNIAAEHGLAFLDTYQIIENIKIEGQTPIGYREDGFRFSTEFVSGLLFGLDGLHLTGKGQAIVANETIEAINQTYGASIPKVNIIDYDAVKFP